MRQISDKAALVAFLLEGKEGRMPPAERAAGVHEGFARFVRERRLGPELAASPRLPEAALPREVLRQLRIDRESTRLLAGVRDQTVARAGRALAAAGLVALPYKGVAVVALTHRDPSRRPMGDIDVIVPRPKRREARAALLAGGFEETTADTPLHDVLRDPASAGPAHPRGIAIEVHVDVFPRPHPFRVDLEGCFARSRPWQPGLHLTDSADALLLSALHVAFYETDARKTWLTLRDVALLTKTGLAAWPGSFPDELSARARDWDLAPVVAEVVQRAAAWAGGSDVVADGLRDVEPASSWRRRAFLRASLAELDAGLATESTPVPRSIPVRMASAAWDESLLGALSFAFRQVFGRGGIPRRLYRYLRAAFGAARRASDR